VHLLGLQLQAQLLQVQVYLLEAQLEHLQEQALEHLPLQV